MVEAEPQVDAPVAEAAVNPEPEENKEAPNNADDAGGVDENRRPGPHNADYLGEGQTALPDLIKL